MASLDLDNTTTPPVSQGHSLSSTGPPTVEDEEVLLENAEIERRKNKQRLREKKLREEEFNSPVASYSQVDRAFENAQKEIDKVLGPRSREEEMNARNKDKKKKKKKKDESQDDVAVEKGDVEMDDLETARQKMHKLLDDAFSVVSHSRSSIGNKIEPSRPDSGDSRSSHRPDNSNIDDSKHQIETKQQSEESQTPEKKHTPLIVERSHEKYDPSGLVTWSPYRAADTTALISLPQPQTDSKPPRQEKTTTTTFTELSLPGSLQPHFYTTQPGDPIVIRSREVDSRPSTHGETLTVNSDSRPPTGQAKTAFQNPTYDSAMNIYSYPFTGMNAFDVIPTIDDLTQQTSHVAEHGPTNSVPHKSAENNISHTAPSSSHTHNQDVADVISQSVRPGACPQPLIDSLRKDLQGLSNRKLKSQSLTAVDTSSGRPFSTTK